jgi:ABC-type Fe3+-hydroxamate transport system substrate-binding protein
MRPYMPVLFIVIILGLLLCAGCSSPQTPVTPTPTITPATTTIPPTTTVPLTTSPPSITPGPTVTVPAGFDTSISIYQDDPTRIINIRYNGGSGQILLQRIDVRVITSKGVVISKFVTNDEGQIPLGYTFSIPGNAGVNRVEVTVTINAVSYKVVDTTIVFR